MINIRSFFSPVFASDQAYGFKHAKQVLYPEPHLHPIHVLSLFPTSLCPTQVPYGKSHILNNKHLEPRGTLLRPAALTTVAQLSCQFTSPETSRAQAVLPSGLREEALFVVECKDPKRVNEAAKGRGSVVLVPTDGWTEP